MKFFWIVLFFLSSLLLLSGCDGRSNAVVVDLSVIAKATGQDEIFKKEIQKASANLNNQLKELAANLDQQLATEKDKIGKAPNKEQQQQFQKLSLQANQKLRQTQSLAQAKVKEFDQQLLVSWHQKIKPIAQEIANNQGSRIVLVSDPSIIWFDSSVDITDEVIAKLRSQSLDVPAGDKSSLIEAETAVDSKN